LSCCGCLRCAAGALGRRRAAACQRREPGRGCCAGRRHAAGCARLPAGPAALVGAPAAGPGVCHAVHAGAGGRPGRAGDALPRAVRDAGAVQADCMRGEVGGGCVAWAHSTHAHGLMRPGTVSGCAASGARRPRRRPRPGRWPAQCGCRAAMAARPRMQPWRRAARTMVYRAGHCPPAAQRVPDTDTAPACSP